MKKRLRSIDTFRGICILWMIIGHSMGWWIISQDYYTELFFYINVLVDAMGAAGFLFISGMSLTLSYHEKLEKVKIIDDYTYERFRCEYLLKAVLLLFIGIGYNLIVVFRDMNIQNLWSWFIFQTIPFCMILFWSLFKINIILKAGIAIGILIFNEIIYVLLVPFRGNFESIFGIIYYFMFNQVELSPFFRYFPFFIIGSLIGDLLYSKISQEKEFAKKDIMISFNLSLMIIGISLIFASLYIIPFEILERFNISWPIYAIGVHLLSFSILLSIESSIPIKLKKKYRFFFYFSYYSFTIFLLHYPIYFIFTDKLSAVQFFPIILITIIIIRFFLVLMYEKFESKFSLKYQLGRLSINLVHYFEKRNSKKIFSLHSSKIKKN